MNPATTPSGKLLLASECAFQWGSALRINYFLEQRIKNASGLKGKIEKEIKRLETKLRKSHNKAHETLSGIADSSALESLLKKHEEYYEAMETVVFLVKSVAEEDKFFKKILPSLQSSLSMSGKVLDMVETRLAEVIRQEIAKRASKTEERDKDNISEPDEEAWEELRKHGEEARHVAWKAVKDLD